MDPRSHWERVYRTKAPNAVSWYAPHLQISLRLIQQVAPHHAGAIIDVGGGEATLVDDLFSSGYEDLTVLDISQVAIDVAQTRMGASGSKVEWIVDDILTAHLPEHRYDVWHDRAVFHFLTSEPERRAYVRQVAHAMKTGGYVIVATFGPKGPMQCSGLDVVRYDADALHAEFGTRFELLDSLTELHDTPFGTTQQFLYCLCKVENEPHEE